MHELSIAQEIVDSVLDSIQSYPGAAVTSVTLTIGKLAGIDHDALRFCFPLACDDTALTGCQLIIQPVPLVVRCVDCGTVAEDVDGLQCPACQSLDVHIVGGRELMVESVEFETQEEATDGNDEEISP